MRVLVTGGTGFLGKNIQDALKPYDKEHVIFYSGSKHDLTCWEKTLKCFDDFRPNVVLHAAALCGGIGLNSRQPADLGRDNLIMGINILEACRIFSIDKLYMIGTTCSYPVDTPVPYKEENLFNGLPEYTNRTYGLAKRTLFALFDSYRKQYGLKGAKFLPGNLYGFYDHFDLKNSHVIPALINKFVTAKENNIPTVNLWGTGIVTREFLFAQDCADVLTKAMLSDFDSELPINLGSGKEISIKSLAELVGKLVGYNGEVVFTGEVSDGQPRRCLDVSRAKELLNWEAQVNLEEGLQKTIDWYKKTYR